MGPCFPSQVPKIKLTPEVTRVIWEHAKGFIDAGEKFDDAISKTASDLGLQPRWVAQAFTEPKVIRPITDEIYRKQGRRREAIRQAKNYIAGIDASGAGKLFQTLWNVPRSALTVGHYAVFPITHGGDLRFRPSQWDAYFKGAIGAWKFASKKAHAAAMSDLERNPLYTMARRGGLDINPESGPVGILASKTGGMSFRGWSGLKLTRMRMFEKEWAKLAPEDQTLEMSKNISEWANHATGSLSPGEKGFGMLEKGMFAPKLTASKWKRAVTDPIKTVTTFAKMAAGSGKEVSAADRHIAVIRLKGAAEYLATYAAFVAANAGFLQTIGSKQKINFSDPSKSDWLRMKVAGHVMNFRGVQETMQLLGKLVALGYATKKQLRGKNQQDAAASTLGKYAQYKIDPTIQTIGEAWWGKDVFGRPLPWTKEPGTPKAPKYTWAEYGLQKGPIPLGGASREIYDTFREQGMSALDATAIMRGLLVGASEMTVGSPYPDPDIHKR